MQVNIIKVIILLLLVVAQNIYAKDVFKVDGFSNDYYLNIVLDLDKESYDENKLSLVSKITNKIVQDFSIDFVNYDLTTLLKSMKNKNSFTLDYSEQEMFKYEDYNFDGKKDFSVARLEPRYGEVVSYDIYLKNKKNFKRSEIFSAFTYEHGYIKKLDSKKHEIVVSKNNYYVNGSIVEINIKYRVINNKPVEISRTKINSDDLPFLNIEYIKNRKISQNITISKNIKYKDILNFKLKNGKKIKLFSFDKNLYYVIYDKNNKIEFYYPKREEKGELSFRLSKQNRELTFSNSSARYTIYEDLFKNSIGIKVEVNSKTYDNKGVFETADGGLYRLENMLFDNMLNEKKFSKTIKAKVYHTFKGALRKPENVYYLRIKNKNSLMIPKEIGKLTNLISLNLENSTIESLPDSICKLKSLENLRLNNNDIKKLPECIGGLKSLKYLIIYKNRLEGLPNSIGELSSLKKLNVRSNKIKHLPESIGKLVQLEHISLEDNLLEELPLEFKNLKKIEYLDLSKNRLKVVPLAFKDMKNIKKLWLGNNNITEIPDYIDKLENLRALGLSHNKISHISKNIANLKFLGGLGLGYNKLERLPDEITELRSLKGLYLSHNNIKSLPKNMNSLNIKDDEDLISIGKIYYRNLYDYKNAIFWFKKVKEKNDNFVNYYIAEIYFKKLKEYKKAVLWYKKSYNNKFETYKRDVTNKIAYLYAVKLKDYKNGTYWCKIASDMGIKGAKKYYNFLIKKVKR